MIDLDNEKTAVLVVDDEESLRLTFQIFLSKEGYGPVKTASTYGEAISLLEQERFDLIISDIVMDGASGIDLLRTVKEKGFQCPVVMVTGYPNINTASEAVRLGAFDYLSKPVKKEDLLRTARMALQQYALLLDNNRLGQDKDRYRKYLEAVFRSVRELVITVSPDRQIIEVNKPAAQWFSKYGITELAGQNIDDLDSAFSPFISDINNVLVSKEEVAEHRIEFGEGPHAYGVFRVSAVPLVSDGGDFLGAVLVARDESRLEALENKGVRQGLHRIIGSSQPMQTVYALIENVGRVDTTVLITGESGTGKELVAEALHSESPRRDMPLIKVDCTAIPENLLESELFGHKKGSFTGADRNREGRILQADGGSLFLDEIGDISPMMQLRLLRFLQERTFYPVGYDQPIKVDVRVIAATNADLFHKVKIGEFREDLYYRLKVVDIVLPPLRQRNDDLEELISVFVRRFSKRLGKKVSGVSDQALAILHDHRWPGNIRELEHVIERAAVLCEDGIIMATNLPPELQDGFAAPPFDPENTAEPFREDEDEELRIINVLRRTYGNKAQAARLLAIDRSTLYRKIRLYNIDVDSIMTV